MRTEPCDETDTSVWNTHEVRYDNEIYPLSVKIVGYGIMYGFLLLLCYILFLM